MNETREQRRKRLGFKNPKKDKWARRNRVDRKKNPLNRFNPFAKKIEPKFDEIPQEQVTEKQAKEVVDRMRRGMQGLNPLAPKESWLDKIKNNRNSNRNRSWSSISKIKTNIKT